MMTRNQRKTATMAIAYGQNVGQSAVSTQIIKQMGKALKDSLMVDSSASGLTAWTAADGNVMNVDTRNRIYPITEDVDTLAQKVRETEAEATTHSDRRSICQAYADCDAPRHKCTEDHLINIWLGYNRYQKAQMLMTLSSGWSILAQLGRALLGHRCVSHTLVEVLEGDVESITGNTSWNGYALNAAKAKLSEDSVREDVMLWVDYIDSTIKEGTGLLTLHRIKQHFPDSTKHLAPNIQDIVSAYNNINRLNDAFDLAGLKANKHADVKDVSYVIDEDRSVCVLLATNFQPRKMKLSRYLKNLGYTDKQTRDLLNILRGEGFTLDIATDKDVIVKGYQGDYSTSCMRHHRSRFSFDAGCNEHPSAVYADCPSVAVAFLRNPSGDVVSRAVINRDDALYSVVYGHPLLDTMLQSEGYQSSLNTLEGQTIRKLPQSNGYILPYLDGNARHVESVNDSFWLCGNDGHASNADGGIYEEQMSICDHCDHILPEDDTTRVVGIDGDDELWCDDCRTNHAEDVGGDTRYDFTHEDNVLTVIDERGNERATCIHQGSQREGYDYCEYHDEYVHYDYVLEYRTNYNLNEDMTEELEYE